LSTHGKGIAKAAIIVALTVVIAKLLVFVLEILLAAWFGTTFIKDAYLVAFVIPNLILMVGAEAMLVSFVPVFMGLLAEDRPEHTGLVVSSLVNITVLFLVTVCIAHTFLAPWIIPLIAPGFDQKSISLAIRLTRIISPIIIWGGLIGLLVAVLHSFKRFTLAASRLILYNSIIIGFVYLFHSRMGIFSLALAVSGGALAQFLLLLPGLWEKKKYYRLTISLKHPEIETMGRVMIPVILGAILVQLNFLIERIMASGLAEGSISSLDFAYKLMRMPFEVFAVAIATVVFPNIAGLVIAEEGSRLREIFTSALRMVAFITIPAALVLIILRVPLIRLLFQRGEFGATSTRMTAVALLYYSFGLFFHGANYVIIRTYYAFKDFVTPLKIGLITIGLYILFSSLFRRYLAHGGLALGLSLAAICYTLMLSRGLQLKVKDLRRTHLLKPLFKILAASSIMGSILIIMSGIELGPPLQKTLLLLLVGALSYGATCFLLKIEEAGRIWKLSRQFIMKGASAS